MADQARIALPFDPVTAMFIGTGGAARARKSYVDGKPTDDALTRNGGTVHRLSGIAASINGIGFDGATIETSTPLENVAAGTIFRAEGECELAVRADAKPGFNGGGPRGVLVVSIYVERLVPVGSAADLLAKAGSGNGRRGGSDAS